MKKWIVYDYPLRSGDDGLAQLVLPSDLTEHEAEKLCGFIRTLAMPEEINQFTFDGGSPELP